MSTAAFFFTNCDILGVKIIGIDPLEPNIWLIVLRVLRRLAAVFQPNCKVFYSRVKTSSIFYEACWYAPLAHPPPPALRTHGVSRLRTHEQVVEW